MELLKKLSTKTDSKIVLLVMDGLGGLPGENGTELEAAKTPNLDMLARQGALGLLTPVAPGITPGSGPGHLGLFGYDPLVFDIGRGILSALGVGFAIEPSDVAARVNFCTVDAKGLITDRRAGRIGTDISSKLCEEMDKIKVDGAEVFVRVEKEHRAALIFRGKDLSGELNDTDPQVTGKAPLAVTAKSASPTENDKRTIRIVSQFIDKAREVLKDKHPANMILTRGFAKFEPIETFPQIYKLNPAAIAAYPMYQGVARLVGMKVLDAGDTPETEFECLKKNWANHDFFFVHIKKTDSYGEDGNFDAKIHIIEQVDGLMPQILALKPDVLAVTADHCTPCHMKAHSHHPIPLLLWGKEVRRDACLSFGETECARGGVGHMLSKDLMAVLMAHAGKLQKYGA